MRKLRLTAVGDRMGSRGAVRVDAVELTPSAVRHRMGSRGAVRVGAVELTPSAVRFVAVSGFSALLTGLGER
ncbi:hypothetical protein GCM10027436_60520 [Actinophytocola sediminis]